MHVYQVLYSCYTLGAMLVFHSVVNVWTPMLFSSIDRRGVSMRTRHIERVAHIDTTQLVIQCNNINMCAL